MKLSLEWISDFVDIPSDLKAEELAHQLTLKTVEVETWVNTADRLSNVVIGRVLKLELLGDNQYARVLCDIGLAQPTIAISNSGNLQSGSVVPVALPGVRLSPDSDVDSRRLAYEQGHRVAGDAIICTAADVGLQRLFPDSSANEALNLAEVDVQPGAALADAIGFNDVVLEIDNKSLTHRPDLWGHYGMARELATVYGRELKPLPRVTLPPGIDGLVGPLDRDMCSRLAVVEFTLDGSATTPLWLRSRLARIGETTVNLPVDLTNYVMFTVGQPSHVYDADRITLPLSVGHSGAAIKLDLLNGESPELDPATPIIRDSEVPVAVAGILGGADSAVSGSSRRFALEVATFRPEAIRSSSHRLALRTEASVRFEKGLDTQRVDDAVNVFLHLLARLEPIASVSGIQDVQLNPTASVKVDLDLDFLAARIGQRLPISEVCRILESLGFAVTVDSSQLHITVPTWRSTGDVSMPHDIVEEVARIHGYDNIPVARLSIVLNPVSQLNRIPISRAVREQLATRAGMQEIMTYPWVADSMLSASGLSKDDTLRFESAPAPDRNSLRPSLVPNLLQAIGVNLPYSQAFSLFEVGTVFAPDHPYSKYHHKFEPLPTQRSMVAAALVGDDGPTLFRQAKGVLQMLHRYCHLTDLRFTDAGDVPWADRQTRLGITSNGAGVGALGLLSASCRRGAGLVDVQVACFALDLDHLTAYPSRENRNEPIPELPESEFDLSIVVADDLMWSEISSTIASNINGLIHRVSFVDEFRGSWVPDAHRSVTARITLRPRGNTLSAQQIGEVRAEVIRVLQQRFGAYLRD